MKTIILATILALSSASLMATDVILRGGTGDGGNVVALVTVDNQVIPVTSIVDVAVGSGREVISLDVSTGSRVYNDEIRSVLLKHGRNPIFEKIISSPALNHILQVRSGGDGGGG